MYNLKTAVRCLMLLVCISCVHVNGSTVCLQAPKLADKRGELYFSSYGFEYNQANPKLKCPDGECFVWADDKLDYNLTFPIDTDLPSSFLLPRKTGIEAISMVTRFFATKDFIRYVHSGCGKHKIFYEGSRFGPWLDLKCSYITEGIWSTLKHNFYIDVYREATKYHCLKTEDVTHDANLFMRTETIPNCGGGGLMGTDLWVPATSVTDSSIMIDINFFNLDPAAAYMWPVCYYTYTNAETLKYFTGSTEPVYIKISNDDGVTLFEYTGSFHRNPNIIDKRFECTNIVVTGTSRLIFTTRLITGAFLQNAVVKFSTPFQSPRPIQVVESKWNWRRRVDTWTQKDACLRLGNLCAWYPIEDYYPEYMNVYGNNYVRKMFSELETPKPKLLSGGLVSKFSYKNGVDAWRVTVDNEHFMTEQVLQDLSEDMAKLHDIYDKDESYIMTSHQAMSAQKRIDSYKEAFGLAHHDQGNWCGEIVTCTGLECLETVESHFRSVTGDISGGNSTIYVNTTKYIILDRQIVTSTIINNTDIHITNNIVNNMVNTNHTSFPKNTKMITEEISTEETEPDPSAVDSDTTDILVIIFSSLAVLGGLLVWAHVIKSVYSGNGSNYQQFY